MPSYSLKTLLKLRKKRRRRPAPRAPELTIAQILAWADEFHERSGRWPIQHSGRIAGGLGETWLRVDNALRNGLRGLAGKSSLAQLLAARRGVRNIHKLPDLTIQGILAWADSHFRRTGKWPIAESGFLAGTGGQTWTGVNVALNQGGRGLPGGWSLARLLAKERGIRNLADLPRLTIPTILEWADDHFRRVGALPTNKSGGIPGTAHETWSSVDLALRKGIRGLPRGSSLARLLAERRGKRNRRGLPRITVPEILAWADAHFRKTGVWPTKKAGLITGGMSDDTWEDVDQALRCGTRGLTKGSSLARVLNQYRGVRNRKALPKLRIKEVLFWADAHLQRTGKWPTVNSGLIPGSSGETWPAVQSALTNGIRGLPGGSSLHRLLCARRGKQSASPAGRKGT